MTGTDLCVRLYKSVPVIFEPPCMFFLSYVKTELINMGSFLRMLNTKNKIWLAVSRQTVYCLMSAPG